MCCGTHLTAGRWLFGHVHLPHQGFPRGGLFQKKRQPLAFQGFGKLHIHPWIRLPPHWIQLPVKWQPNTQKRTCFIISQWSNSCVWEFFIDYFNLTRLPSSLVEKGAFYKYALGRTKQVVSHIQEESATFLMQNANVSYHFLPIWFPVIVFICTFFVEQFNLISNNIFVFQMYYHVVNQKSI